METLMKLRKTIVDELPRIIFILTIYWRKRHASNIGTQDGQRVGQNGMSLKQYYESISSESLMNFGTVKPTFSCFFNIVDHPHFLA